MMTEDEIITRYLHTRTLSDDEIIVSRQRLISCLRLARGEGYKQGYDEGRDKGRTEGYVLATDD